MMSYALAGVLRLTSWRLTTGKLVFGAQGAHARSIASNDLIGRWRLRDAIALPLV